MIFTAIPHLHKFTSAVLVFPSHHEAEEAYQLLADAFPINPGTKQQFIHFGTVCYGGYCNAIEFAN